MSTLSTSGASNISDVFFPVTRDSSSDSLGALFCVLGADGFGSVCEGEGFSATRPTTGRGSVLGKTEGERFVEWLAGRYLAAPNPDVSVGTAGRDAITIVYDRFYVDEYYRDSYYEHYSRQYFEIGRFCARLVFFSGALTEADWDENADSFNDRILASVVLSPLVMGGVVRAFIDPRPLLGDASIKLRVSTYSINLFGHRFSIAAFPYRKQDGEFTRCAEVTVLNLMEYFTREFDDYGKMYGSRVLRIASEASHERSIPSRGMTYSALSKALVEGGLYPTLYNDAVLRSNAGLFGDGDLKFKRILHCAIDSGIPVAVNPLPTRDAGEGHSLICIGYSDKSSERRLLPDFQNRYLRFEYKAVRDENGNEDIESAGFGCILNNSGDYCSQYVVVDDAQNPYSIRPFNRLTVFSAMHNATMCVPLHKSMVLGIADAYEAFVAIVADPKFGIHNLASKYLDDNRPDDGDARIVMRPFLASSKRFKRMRIDAIKGGAAKDYRRLKVYEMLPFPHFVWVCELYLEEKFLSDKPVAFAELVVDATSLLAKGAYPRSIILFNCPHLLVGRSLTAPSEQFEFQIDVDPADIEPYAGNLMPAAY